jgi:murein DD-endopeptidase MepM/ murein hydrolase activator NlpD
MVRSRVRREGQHRSMRRSLTAALLTAALALAAGAPADATPTAAPGGARGVAQPTWSWPVAPPRVIAGYAAPASAYGAGHRGIDLAANEGAPVVAVDDGVVAFVGTVVDRAVITIRHDDGVVSTLEPVASGLPVGARIAAGDQVGTVTTGGHVAPGGVHLGARLHGTYVNPLLFLGRVERAVLLPCCG